MRDAEINRGYLDHLRGMNRLTQAVGSSQSHSFLVKAKWYFSFRAQQLITLVDVITLGLSLDVWLRLVLLVRRKKTSELAKEAIANVDELIEQYPFHLYPIVCKTFELAYLQAQRPRIVTRDTRVVEVAIGE